MPLRQQANALLGLGQPQLGQQANVPEAAGARITRFDVSQGWVRCEPSRGLQAREAPFDPSTSSGRSKLRGAARDVLIAGCYPAYEAVASGMLSSITGGQALRIM